MNFRANGFFHSQDILDIDDMTLIWFFTLKMQYQMKSRSFLPLKVSVPNSLYNGEDIRVLRLNAA